jgi:hypothetical protein
VGTDEEGDDEIGGPVEIEEVNGNIGNTSGIPVSQLKRGEVGRGC